MNIGAIIAPIYRSVRAEWRRSHPEPPKPPKMDYPARRAALMRTVREEQEARRRAQMKS